MKPITIFLYGPSDELLTPHLRAGNNTLPKILIDFIDKLYLGEDRDVCLYDIHTREFTCYTTAQRGYVDCLKDVMNGLSFDQDVIDYRLAIDAVDGEQERAMKVSQAFYPRVFQHDLLNIDKMFELLNDKTAELHTKLISENVEVVTSIKARNDTMTRLVEGRAYPLMSIYWTYNEIAVFSQSLYSQLSKARLAAQEAVNVA